MSLRGLTAPARARQLLGLAAALACGAALASPAHAGAPLRFDMVRSAAVTNAGCLLKARASVTVTPLGPVERLEIKAWGLPANTEFDVFVIQVPNAPFGLSWYQGDLETNGGGNAKGTFLGRFNVETFIVAPGVAPAPVVHTSPILDANTNPATAPVHTYHLGIWFNSPADALKAGCPSAMTPFNGEHDAGIQVLSTQNFPIDAGPLRQLNP